jgi:hypothetical protein
MEFLCNMKITVEAQRPKSTSSNAQDVNLTVIQKHTVQNYMPALNVEKTTTQPHIGKYQIHQQNVRCAEVIILQATKDARCTRTCNKTEASYLTKLHTESSSQKSIFTILTNSHLSTQNKPRLKCLSHHKPRTHKPSNENSNHPPY